jgi:hypothetical protein
MAPYPKGYRFLVGLESRPIGKGPETICDLGAGVPHHSELEPSGGVPHGLGGAAEDGGVRLRSVSAAVASPS